MGDPRLHEYARLLVERSLDVQPGWQVLIRTTPLARPLLEEIVRAIARRGAYAITRMGFTIWPADLAWAEEAPLALLREMPEIDRYACDHMDARITIDAPENTREEAEFAGERWAALREGRRYFFRRTIADEIPWVGCQFPTAALAQESGMSLGEFEEFIYGACLLDWDEEGRKMRRLVDRFDAADEVRIEGPDTDLTLSLEGRQGEVDAGEANMPGGEFYFAPVEDSAEGTITFSEFPAEYGGRDVEGIRLVFERGVVVESSATTGQDVLEEVLDTDEGARRVGELGIGCNMRVQRFMRNLLFDEKIGGTVHLALGASYTSIGGLNESQVHWDIVKDLRTGGRLYCDGELVQENGNWLI